MLLKDLCTHNVGTYGIGASASSFNKNYPTYLRITDITDDGKLVKPLRTSIDPNSYPDWKDYILSKNDLVFARTGNSTGRNYFHNSNDELVYAGFLIRFSLNPEKIVPRYVGYYCQSKSYWNQICSLLEGSTRPTMNAELYKKLDIPIVSKAIQQHIVDTIGSVDDLIENYDNQTNEICSLLKTELRKFSSVIPISCYNPKIIKSGIKPFVATKIYLDTSSAEGINEISSGEIVTFDKRPSRANMQPMANSVWFAKMKASNKIIVVSEDDDDLITQNIFSTGFLGIEATKNLPLSLLTAFLISDDFRMKRDMGSVGTTMASINNDSFLSITVPYLNNEEIDLFDSKYKYAIQKLCLLRRKIVHLRQLKTSLLKKYF